MIMLIVNVVDMDMTIRLIISTVEMDVHRNDDQYGGCGSNQAGNEGYGVKRHIGSNQRHHFYGNSSYTNTKHF